MSKAKLILFPIPIVEGDISHIPTHNHEMLSNVQHFVVERLRTSRRFIRKALPEANIDEMEFIEIDKRDALAGIDVFNEWINAGVSVGLMSESGNPCIADPGHVFVAEAHKQNIEVVPLVGPSSILLSLIASGFNGQNFEFHGYLPIKDGPLRQKLLDLEKEINKFNKTQIFIETPYRNHRMLEQIKKHLNANTKLCVGIEINSPEQSIISKPLKAWHTKELDGEKKNMIFLLGAP